jgi:hypothetical protein
MRRYSFTSVLLTWFTNRVFSPQLRLSTTILLIEEEILYRQKILFDLFCMELKRRGVDLTDEVKEETWKAYLDD